MKVGKLERLEGPAGPRALVLRWLAGAHAFPTLAHYVEWLLTQGPGRWPLVALPKEAVAHVRREMRGRPAHEVDRAVRDAVAETAFLIELILLINAHTEDRRRMAALRYQLAIAEIGLLAQQPDAAVTDSLGSGGPPPTEGHASAAERVDSWHSTVSMQSRLLTVAEESRRIVEERYLDGQSALFPLTADGWAAVREASNELASLAADVLGRISTLSGDDDDASALRLATRLTDTARSATLGLLGDARGARAVYARGLQGMGSARL